MDKSTHHVPAPHAPKRRRTESPTESPNVVKKRYIGNTGILCPPLLSDGDGMIGVRGGRKKRKGLYKGTRPEKASNIGKQ